MQGMSSTAGRAGRDVLIPDINLAAVGVGVDDKDEDKEGIGVEDEDKEGKEGIGVEDDVGVGVAVKDAFILNRSCCP